MFPFETALKKYFGLSFSFECPFISVESRVSKSQSSSQANTPSMFEMWELVRKAGIFRLWRGIMRAIILFIACIFVFETVGYSCVSAPVKKSPAKKHDSKKQVSRKSSSKARVLASVSKASSIKKAPTKTKNSKKTQIIPLPRKKHAAMEKNNVRRKITSEKSKPNPSKNTAQRSLKTDVSLFE